MLFEKNAEMSTTKAALSLICVQNGSIVMSLTIHHRPMCARSSFSHCRFLPGASLQKLPISITGRPNDSLILYNLGNTSLPNAPALKYLLSG
eukprot:COSAG02_NODE_7016_length_3226_cov_23.259034_2_plen_92_part_00